MPFVFRFNELVFLTKGEGEAVIQASQLFSRCTRLQREGRAYTGGTDSQLLRCLVAVQPESSPMGITSSPQIPKPMPGKRTQEFMLVTQT
jgi:hypothetical protein